MALDAILRQNQASWWQRFYEAPCPTIAKTLYAQRQRLVLQQPHDEASTGITVVCVSDTHNSRPNLPPGDVLIHAGDLTRNGSAEEVQAQLDWMNAKPYLHKVVVAGNHDVVLDDEQSAELGMSPQSRQSLRWGSIIYLEHSGTTLKFPSGRTLTIFGHPSTSRHGQGIGAFRYDKHTDKFSNLVTDDVDILVTHAPPKFHCDGPAWGDKFLLQELWRVRPKLHVFGHIHEGYGRDVLVYDQFESLYARVCAGSAGLLAILQMVHFLVVNSTTGCRKLAERSILINAAAVGDFRDRFRDRNAHKVQVVKL